MPKCSLCGASFKKDKAREIFEEDYCLRNYDCFIKPVCGECAKEVFSGDIDGFYEETCDCCGKKFDPIIDDYEFSRYVDGIGLGDISYTMCCECALDDMERRGMPLNTPTGF